MRIKNWWQQGQGGGSQALSNNQGISEQQFITFVLLFIIMVTVWSGVLIGTIFSLRGTWDRCAKCPESCGCASPVWG